MDDEIINKYTDEARERWGDTDAFKQAEERVRKMGKEGLQKVLDENGAVTKEITEAMHGGEDPRSDKVQKLIHRHYNGLRAFYKPSLQMYRDLAEMYVTDPRFRANYEKVASGLAQFMHDAMIVYVDANQ